MMALGANEPGLLALAVILCVASDLVLEFRIQPQSPPRALLPSALWAQLAHVRYEGAHLLILGPWSQMDRCK